MYVDLQMQSLGIEEATCCGRKFERGERMNAVVANDGTPLGWYCDQCINAKKETHQDE